MNKREGEEDLEKVARTLSPHQYIMQKEHIHPPDIFHTSREAHSIYDRKLPPDDIIDNKFHSGAIHHPSNTLLKSMEIAHKMAEEEKCKHHHLDEKDISKESL